jgi:hypothetical protein
MWRLTVAFPIFILLLLIGINRHSDADTQAVPTPGEDRIILEDFSKYPEGWEARGGFAKANEVYQPVRSEQEVYLRAQGGLDPVRIFNKIAWDSKNYPIVQWKWRVREWPQDPAAQVSLYVSLDRDSFGVPTLTKYVWSRESVKGAVKGGGFFKPTEVVLRSETTVSDEWIMERIDALADFRNLIGRDPRGKTYGIGILMDPGVVVEIDEIVALKE